MKLQQAKNRHEIVRSTLAQWNSQPAHHSALEEAWRAAVGEQDKGSAMASAVRTAIPLDYIPLFCSADCTPLSYFLVCMSEVLSETNITDAQLADMLVCGNIAAAAVTKFEIRRQQADSIQEGFGSDRSAAWATLRKCDDYSTRVTRKMVEIAKLAGRMFKTMAYEGMPKPTNDPQMVTGIDGGDDPTRMLDEEIAMLNVPGADADTLSRLEEKQVLEFEMTGEILHGRGPLVVTVDESGSMHEHRQVWSKACAVALARIALAEGRRVRVVHFSTATVVRDLDPNDPDCMRELAWHHLGGGTSVHAAMNVSNQQVRELAHDGAVGADIVFITDGLDNYGEGPFKTMKKAGTQLWTIAIDVDMKQIAKQYNTDTYLVDYATKYMHVNDKSLRSQEGVDAVAQLKEAALNNESRESVGTDDSDDNDDDFDLWN